MAPTAMTERVPLISVCIANYNGMAVIDDCLRSVMAQQGNITVEILVHDDASSDGSVAYIRDHYPVVKLIVSESNVGFCIGNNRMAGAAKGQYLLLLNNDATLYPDALQSLLAEANNIGKPAILTLPQYDATTGVMVDRGCLLDPFFNPVPNLDPKRTDVAMVIGACLWVPMSLWNELEGFPEWFGSIAEDMYLCCRARLAGYAVRALAVSGYRHWQGKSFGGGKVVVNRLSTTFKRRALSERNKFYVIVLTCPSPCIQIIVPLHGLSLVLEGIALNVMKRSFKPGREIYFSCVAYIWGNLGHLLDQRRSVQITRKISNFKFLSMHTCWPHKLRMLARYGIPNIQ
jgi:GT2 family glycosyltransferase